jgi:tRNA-dihydrouridine synthase B
VADVRRWLTAHLLDHYALYGEQTGVKSARKHIGWALAPLPGGAAFRDAMNRIDDCATQWRAVDDWFAQLEQQHRLLPETVAANDEHDATEQEEGVLAA